MTDQEKAAWFIAHPVALCHELGYRQMTAMHGEWITKMVTGTEDMTLQAHRGSYKTTCLGVAIALMMINLRDKNIIFLRKTDTDVIEVIKNVDRILNEPIFREICHALTGVPLEVVRSTASEVVTNYYCAPRGAPQLLGIGISGSLTGKHADRVITDDIINLKDRVSQAEREHTKAVYQELQNVRNPGGRMINTGTPWHKDDAFSLMPPAEVWDYRRTGKLSEKKIAELRESMTPSLFAANYELRHIAEAGALFTKAPEFFEGDELLYNGFSHVDASSGGDDATAFTCAKRVGDTVYMYGRKYRTHVDTVMDAIISDATRFRCFPVYCERNSDKGYLKKEFFRKGIFSTGYDEKENKYVKIATYLKKWWGNIKWHPDTDPEYLEEILDYTITAQHDDCPDSAACCARIFDKALF